MQPIHIPDLAYDCVMCGRSCRQRWSIVVDEELQAAILASQGAQRAKERGYLPLNVGQQPVEVGRREDHGCALLNDDELCSIHGELGFQAKPHPCRQFPFHPIPGPDGFYLGMSFACKAVQEGLGRPLEAHRTEVESLVEELIERHGLKEHENLVPLDEERTATWDEYLQFETNLRQQLQPELLEPMLLHAAFAVAEESPLPPRVQFAEMVVSMVLSSVVSLIEERTPGPGRNVIAEAFSEGKPYFSPRLQREVEPILPEPVYREQTLRYLDHVLFRKYLTHGNMVGRLLFMAVVTKALDYFAHQEAYLAGRESPDLEDYFAGLATIEVDVMLHADGVETMHGLLSHGFQMAIQNFPAPTN